MALNYNRFCNITLFGKKGTFQITTPRFGRKPDIEVHGILYASEFAKDFEVRIRNLYTDVDLTLFNSIKISAGYFDKPELMVEGSIAIIYTEQPGPDRVTVIKCWMGAAEHILNATVDNLEMPEGSTLKAILESMTSAMQSANIPDSTNPIKVRWKAPQVDASTGALTSPSKLSWNGGVKDLLGHLKSMFPGIYFTIGNDQIIAFNPKQRTLSGFGSETEGAGGKIVPLKYLLSPPNYTAGRVIVTAPWEPGLKPGDIIYILNTNIGTKEATATISARQEALRSMYSVLSVQFDFSTVGSQNKMIVTGV